MKNSPVRAVWGLRRDFGRWKNGRNVNNSVKLFHSKKKECKMFFTGDYSVDLNAQQLYLDVPPTKLRNRDEKFREAKTGPFWIWLADRFFYGMLENRFYSMMIKNKSNYDKRNPEFSNILYAPHDNWWDGIVGYNLCRRVFRTEIRMMIEELNRFPILAKAGAFAVNKKSPQASMKALKYAVDQLKDKKRSLWIFPQGIIRPPMYRPIEFQTGMAYIAEKVVKETGGVNLIPISTNFMFLREDRPEVLVEIGEPIVLTDPSIPRKDLNHQLETNFEALCDRQLEDIRKGDVEGYEYVFKQKLKWYRKLEKRLKRVKITQSGV